MRILLFKTLQALANMLPLACSYALADFGGRLQYLLSRKDRDAVRGNLTTLFKRAPTSKEVIAVFQNFGRYLVDLCRMTRVITPEYIKEHIDVDGVEHIDALLARGRGGVILTAHLGNWEVGGAIIAQLGYPFYAIALPHAQSSLNDWFNAQRRACGIHAVPPQEAVRSCLKVLRSNKLIAIVTDRDFTKTGVRMPFLGRDFLVPKGAATFAYKTGAGVVPSFFYKQDNGRWCLKCFKPVYADRIIDGTISEQEIKNFAQQYLSVFDTMIRKHATQWLMFREYGKEV